VVACSCACSSWIPPASHAQVVPAIAAVCAWPRHPISLWELLVTSGHRSLICHARVVAIRHSRRGRQGQAGLLVTWPQWNQELLRLSCSNVEPRGVTVPCAKSQRPTAVAGQHMPGKQCNSNCCEVATWHMLEGRGCVFRHRLCLLPLLRVPWLMLWSARTGAGAGACFRARALSEGPVLTRHLVLGARQGGCARE